MKEIPLTQGYISLVDDEDYPQLIVHRWQYLHGYAVRGYRDQKIYMHRVVLNAPKGLRVDHINRNPLDNRKTNLRLATVQENSRNISGYPLKRKSQYKGVTWHKQVQKWQAQIKTGKEQIYLGLFASESDAARAYDAMARELFGEFAYLNFSEAA